MSLAAKKNLFHFKSVLAFLILTSLLLLISQMAYAHGMSEADKQAIVDGGNLHYFWIGATHMLTGYDHLAFVFGIIFFLSHFRDIVKYVTAFTVGHSITLIGATFYAIQVNYFLIDAVIALSVCYIAFSNLDGFRQYLKVNPPNMMIMILGLGLIHGLGLSTRLQELPLSGDSLLLNIISFNLGIELGQVSALAIMLLLIAAWRKRDSFNSFSLIANYGLIFFGLFLFLMQMHDYSHDQEKAPEMVMASAPSSTAGSTTSAQREDRLVINLPPRGEIEYKFNMNEGDVVDYTWSTKDTALFFDFHGEPKGDTTGYFKSYQKSTLSRSTGSFTPPFTGIHGWYWKNNSVENVEIVLELKGHYQLSESYEKKRKAVAVSVEPEGEFMDIEPAK
ncbi:MAG: HupE/UreJ family protein [Mariprofundaceae bacterium]|nr:HupE/UreJ family protein [Mariprofundaceae bacterium]